EDVHLFRKRIYGAIPLDKTAMVRDELDGVLYRAYQALKDPQKRSQPLVRWITAVKSYQALLDSAEWIPRTFLLARDERVMYRSSPIAARVLDMLCEAAKRADPTRLVSPFEGVETLVSLERDVESDVVANGKVWRMRKDDPRGLERHQDPLKTNSLSGELFMRMKEVGQKGWNGAPQHYRWILTGPRMNVKVFVEEMDQLLESTSFEVQGALQTFMESDDLWGRMMTGITERCQGRLIEFQKRYDSKPDTNMVTSLVTGEAWDLTGATPAHELDHSVMALVSASIAAIYSLLVYIGWRIWILKRGPPENWDQIKKDLRQYPFSYLPRKINPIGNKPGVFIRAMALSTNDHHRLLR
ncbi:hypothetical protein BVX98_03550, partial [bacterium F11]